MNVILAVCCKPYYFFDCQFCHLYHKNHTQMFQDYDKIFGVSLFYCIFLGYKSTV